MEFLSAFTLPNEQGQAMDLVVDAFLKVPPPKLPSVQVSVCRSAATAA